MGSRLQKGFGGDEPTEEEIAGRNPNETGVECRRCYALASQGVNMELEMGSKCRRPPTFSFRTTADLRQEKMKNTS